MKNRLQILIALLLLLLAPLAALQAADAPKQSKPNIVLIYTDDHGYSDLGCMGIMKDVKTPNIDALASGGVRMTSGYVTAPQCSPSRCGVIGGQYQGKFGMDHNGMLESDPALVDRFRALNNLPKRLKQAGYVKRFVVHTCHSDATQKYLDRFPDPMPIERRKALGAIACMDDGIGKIMETLRKNGVEENTLIFLIADNGAPLKMMPHAFVTDGNGLKTLKPDTPKQG